MRAHKVREYVMSLPVGDYQVRVWCGTPVFSEAQFANINRLIEEVRAAQEMVQWGKNNGVSESQEQIAERFAALSFCNAVEVKGSDYAVIIYPDWP